MSNDPLNEVSTDPVMVLLGLIADLEVNTIQRVSTDKSIEARHPYQGYLAQRDRLYERIEIAARKLAQKDK